MVASPLRLAGLDWPVPDYSTLCRRQKTLKVQIPYRRADGPLNLLVDSTNIKFLGDSDLQASKHGVQGRRHWRKVHLAMDTVTSDIRAVEFTPSREGDSPLLRDLLGQIPEYTPATPRSRWRARAFPRRLWTGPRSPPLPRRQHRRRWHGHHPDPQEWPTVEGGQPSRPSPQRNPACHTPSRPGVLETVDGIPRPQPRRGQDVLPQVLRRAHRRKRP